MADQAPIDLVNTNPNQPFYLRAYTGAAGGPTRTEARPSRTEAKPSSNSANEPIPTGLNATVRRTTESTEHGRRNETNADYSFRRSSGCTTSKD